MKGDFTRSTFNRAKRYTSVRMQQGRVQLDADWNEQVDIANHRLETGLADVIGACGAPKEKAGFALEMKEGQLFINPAFFIEDRDKKLPVPSYYYVDGIRCEIEQIIPFTNQPDYPRAVLPAQDGEYIAYLDVWQHHVSVLDDPDLRDLALNIVDTTTRTRTVWQVKLLPVTSDQEEDWQALIALRNVKMAAQAVPLDTPPEQLRLASELDNFRGLSNQLYRVEVHSPGRAGVATFKWSRDNGIVAQKVAELSDKKSALVLSGPMRDERFAFEPKQWVEVLDCVHELGNGRGALARLTSQTAATKLYFDPATATEPINDKTFSGDVKVRRWDHNHNKDEAEVRTSNLDWINLEEGLQIKFSGAGEFHTGDYWLIPTRSINLSIDWPLEEVLEGGEKKMRPRPLPPNGIAHHYCRLAVLTKAGDTWEIEDQRDFFPALAGIDAEDVGFDNEHCIKEHPEEDWAKVETVQQAFEQICQQLRCPEFLKHRHNDGVARNLDGTLGLEVFAAPHEELKIRFTPGIAYVGGCRHNVSAQNENGDPIEIAVDASTTHQTIIVNDEGRVACVISEFPAQYAALAVVSTYEGEIKRIVDVRFEVSQLDHKLERNVQRAISARSDRRQFVPLLAHSIKGLQYREGRNRAFDLASIIDAPAFDGKASNLAFDGESIWVANSAGGMIAKIPREAAEVSEIKLVELGDEPTRPFHTAAVAFDGRHLWFTLPQRDSVLRLDPATKESLELFTGMGAPPSSPTYRPTALAFDGDFIWVCNTDHPSVSMIDVETCQVLQVLALPHPAGASIRPNAIAFDGSHVWIAAAPNLLYRIEKPWGQPELVLEGAGDFPYAQGDMTFDGSHLWIAAKNSQLAKLEVTSLAPEVIPLGGPQTTALACDGAHIWLASSNSSLHRIDVASNQSAPVNYNFQNPPTAALFDGAHLWISAGTRVFKRLV